MQKHLSEEELFLLKTSCKTGTVPVKQFLTDMSKIKLDISKLQLQFLSKLKIKLNLPFLTDSLIYKIKITELRTQITDSDKHTYVIM